MATVRPFAYNTGSTISGTEQIGNLAIGVYGEDYSGNYGGVKWWMGPDEDLGYVIAFPVSGNTQPTQPGIIPPFGSVGFLRTSVFSDESFINLSEYVSDKNGTPQTFSTTSDAKNWLNTNGYWTSYNVIVVTPTSTPTNTPTNTVTNTPTVTQTPTNSVTPTNTQTNTPSNTVSSTATNTPTPTLTPTNTNTPTVTPTPNLVTSGLVIQLDAYNSTSYSGGTTVFDLTSGYNHTLTNAPYTELNTIKCFDCNGTVATSIRVNGTGPTLPTSGYTYISWVRIKNNTTTYRTLYRTAPNDHPVLVDISTNNLGFYDNDTPAFFSAGYSVAPIADTWVQLTVVGDSTGSTFYVNSTLVGTTAKGAGGNRHDYWGSIAGQPFGYVANMYYYNKKLSLSEITQQYNFLSPRFVEPTPTPTTTPTTTPTPTPSPVAKFYVYNNSTNRTISNINGNGPWSLSVGSYPISPLETAYGISHPALTFAGLDQLVVQFGGTGAIDISMTKNGSPYTPSSNIPTTNVTASQINYFINNPSDLIQTNDVIVFTITDSI